MLSKRGDGGESGGIRRFTTPGNVGGIGNSGGGGDDGGDDPPDRKHKPPPSYTTVVDNAARKVAHCFGYSLEDTEDFCQAAQVYVLEKPQILTDFRGGEEGCSLAGYLIGVLRNFALDRYRQVVGKWHSSAKAKRLGPEAEHLEALRYRDHLDSALAISRLLEKFPSLPRPKALELDEQLKPRSLRDWVGDGPLEHMAGTSRADEGIQQHELAAIERRIQKSLQEALAEMDLEDRVMVKAIFGKGQSIKDFALFQGIRQRQMYSRFDRLRASLRRKLEAQGITAEESLRIIGWSDSALHLDLDSETEIPENPARSLPPGDRGSGEDN